MATAIAETADATRQRAEVEAAIRAENDALAHEHVRLKKLGLITDLIPLDRFGWPSWSRDRTQRPDPELGDLKASIRAIGLSNPIRVEPAEGGFELVQGFRRLTAYRELLEETGDARFARSRPGCCRRAKPSKAFTAGWWTRTWCGKDISFAEMGMLVLNYLEDHPNEADDAHGVTERLYSSANRQKRSHIRTFVRLMQDIGHALRHPEAIPRALGSDLVRKFEEDDGLAGVVAAQLNFLPDEATAEDELAVLRAVLDNRAPPPVRTPSRTKAVGKTTLKLARPGGVAKCTASDGKVELRFARDFSAIDRARLEEAIEAFLDALDG